MTDFERAVQLLLQGQLVAFPTETVYGLGADATNADAVARIFSTKGRPGTNPVIVHVSSVEMAKSCVSAWPEMAQKLAEQFWPGPLTLVLPRKPDSDSAGFHFPDNVTAGLNTVGIRMPDHPLALQLIDAVGRPLAAPSANRSTRVSPTTASHVRDEFPSESQLPLILDGGPCRVGIESTVVSLVKNVPEILRPGQISADAIQLLIGPVLTPENVHQNDTLPKSSPGQHFVHYSPETPTFWRKTGDWILDRQPGFVLIDGNDATSYAQTIYERLRAVDKMGLKEIVIEMPPDLPEWVAIADRIRRAGRPWNPKG